MESTKIPDEDECIEKFHKDVFDACDRIDAQPKNRTMYLVDLETISNVLERCLQVGYINDYARWRILDLISEHIEKYYPR